LAHNFLIENEAILEKLKYLQQKISEIEGKQDSSVQALFDLICVLAHLEGKTAEEMLDILLKEDYVYLRSKLIGGLRRPSLSQKP
jgi:hypothetical protein